MSLFPCWCVDMCPEEALAMRALAHTGHSPWLLELEPPKAHDLVCAGTCCPGTKVTFPSGHFCSPPPP